MKNKVFSCHFQFGLLVFLLLFFIGESLVAFDSYDVDYFAKIKRPTIPIIQTKSTPPPEQEFIPFKSDQVLKYEPGKVLVKLEKNSKSDILAKARSKFPDLQVKDIFPVSEKISKSSNKTNLREKYGLNKAQIIFSDSIKQSVLQIDEEKLRQAKKISVQHFEKKNLPQDENGEKVVVNKFSVDGVLFYELSDGEIIDEKTLELLTTIPGAKLNKLAELAFDVNDIYYSKMWNLNEEVVTFPRYDRNNDGDFEDNSEYSWSYANTGVNVQEGWEKDQSNLGEEIVVAVVDTGVQTDHEDLSVNIWSNSQEIPDNGIDDDENGYTDDVNGYNFSDLNNYVGDYYGHGTHVAGIIAASQNNNLGITGVAPNVKIMSLRVFPNSYEDVIAEAIIYAADNGAKVINMSLAGRGVSTFIEDAIDYAYDLNVSSVVAAGNDYSYARYVFPANIKPAITVGASNYWDFKPSFSNFGPEIDVTAPGTSILSLRATGTDMSGNGRYIYEDNYYIADGTSMATPHVAGIAALIFANHPEFTVEQVNQVLRSSAEDLSYEYEDELSGFDENSGYGRVDLGKALDIVMPPEVIWYEPLNYEKVRRDIPLSGKVYAKDLISWSVKYKDVDSQDTLWQAAEFYYEESNNNNTEGFLGMLNTLSIPDGEVYLKLEVITQSGITACDIIKVEVDNVYFISPDPKFFNIFGKENIDFFGHVEGPRSGTYELSYQPEECDISDESCWQRIKMWPVRNAFYEGKLGMWRYRANIDRFKRKGVYRIRLKYFNPEGFSSEAYMKIFVDDDIKEGWPVEIPRYFREVGENMYLYKPNILPTSIADLDGDSFKEITAVSYTNDMDQARFSEDRRHLYIYNHQGELLGAGWPYDETSMEGYYIYRLDSQDPVLYDFDGDGDKEIFMVGVGKEFGNNQYRRYFVMGFDALGNRLDQDFPIQLFDNNLPFPDYVDDYLGQQNTSLVIEDIENDGQIEFIYHSRNGDISVVDFDGNFLPGWPKYLSTTEEDVAEPTYFIRPFETWITPAVGDINQDFVKDIISPVTINLPNPEDPIYYQNGADLYAFNGVNGSILWSRRLNTGGVGSNMQPTLADINNDGNLEIIIGDSRGMLYVLDSNGNDIFDWPQRIPGRWWGSDNNVISIIWGSPVVGNLDSDPELEIVVNSWVGTAVYNHDGSLKWNKFFYKNDPACSEDCRISDEYAFSFDSPIITNVDGDDNPDILIADSYKVYAFDQHGNNIPGWPLKFLMTDTYDHIHYLSFPKIEDIDNDNKLELIISLSWVLDGHEGKDRIIVYDLDVPVSARNNLDHWPMFHHDLQHTGRYTVPIEIPETEEATGDIRGRVKGKVEEWRNRIEDALGGQNLPKDFEGIFDGVLSAEVLEDRLQEIMSLDGSLSKDEQILIDEIIDEAMRIQLFEGIMESD